jgi:hypothetical protein
MRNCRAVFLILCLLCVGLVAACGDDNKSSDSGGSDTEDFVAQADQLCIEVAREALANPQPTPTTAEEAVPILEESVRRREETIGDLEDLGEPPSEIATEWKKILAGSQERLAITKQLLKLSEQGVPADNQKYAGLVASSSESGDESKALYKQIGSTACAQVLPPSERKKIIDLVTFWETQPLDDCEKYTTPDGIELAFGSVKACQKAQLNPPPEGFTQEVHVTHIEGIPKVNASVDASLEGGIGDGEKVTYTVVFLDGRYKVDAVTLQAGETG